MTKLMLAAAFAAVALTSFASAPVNAQVLPDSTCPNGQCGGSSSTPDRCGDQLGHLKRVFPAQVRGIDNHYRVWVTEFCPTADLMRSDGNAAYLRTTIAQNDVLVDVLSDKGYFASDVFAVRMMGEDTISLYVHRFGD
ncbi:hypothetical protein PRN20_08230 [Devosia sp. ZB163]|uniref:hypothetical protein n=1 Tax=Devosia sp. ZB163 TaxID=3025938 RepID=UPI0023628664|nr:hypothetical protein [Devosia sp. ZB163]MDC9823717.1 hypothetical protein [Devosia sp. ZB163]